MAEYWKTAVRSVLALPQERVIASWAPVAVTAMPRRAGALSQVTGVMPPASSRSSAESPDRAEEREVEDDSPFWLLHAAELADLEVGEGREEAGRETDERGEGLAGRKFGLEHERDAEETQHDGCGACAAERLAVLYGEEDDDEGQCRAGSCS